MKSNRLIVISFLLLFFSSLFLLFRTLFDNDKDIETSLIDDETAANYISSYIDLMVNNGRNADMLLVDVHDGSLVSIEDLFKENDSIVYMVCRINEMDCDECTDYALSKFIESDTIITGKNIKKIIIGTYDSFTSLTILTPNNMDCYYTPSLNIPMDERGYPYYFVMDSSLRVFDVFSPNKGYSQLIDTYFELVKQKWSKV